MLNLVTVVGRNTHMLPHMLKYYKELVDKMYVVVYRDKEDDTILHEVEELGITPLCVVTEPKYNWERVTHIYNTVKLLHPNDWWIVADDDELQVYPEDLDTIIECCQRNGYTFVTGGFIDRIGEDGTFPEVTRDTNILEAFPLAGFFRYPMSNACPNKVTLMKGHQEITSGQHYAKFKDGTNSWGTEHPKRMPVEECFTQVHHFKWDKSCSERILDVANTKKSYTYYEEYQRMYDGIKENNFRIDIKNTNFYVDRMKNNSYIDYKDYSYWNKLTQLIIKI